MFIAAIEDWAAGRMQAAIARHRAILAQWPTDLLSLKLVTYHQFNRGTFAQMLATVEAALPANRHVSQMRGVHAFALGQCGRHREAEIAGREAVALGGDPWAQHAVAHVLDLAGEAREGAAFMAAHQADWDDCSSFLYTHNWWHAALFHIALGDTGGALRLYDDRVWSRRRDHCQDQINAAALLTRLELAGMDVGDRWADLGERVAPAARDHLNGFLDLHYVLALARSGRAAELGEMLAGLEDLPATGEHTEISATLAAAARGLAAWGMGDHERTVAPLSAARFGLARLGGSDVQREMFELILIDAARRSGDGLGARRLEIRREGRRGAVAWQRRALAPCDIAVRPLLRDTRR